MKTITPDGWIEDFKFIFGCAQYPRINTVQLDFMKGKAQIDYESGKITLWTYRQLEKEFEKVVIV